MTPTVVRLGKPSKRTFNQNERTYHFDITRCPEKGCYYAVDKKTGKEVNHVHKHLLHCEVIAKLTPMFVDMKYCELTTLDIPEQKKKYGYE